MMGPFICRAATMFAINPDGTLKWNYVSTGGGFSGCAPALAQDGTVYALRYERLYAFYPNNTEKWFYHSDAIFWYSSPCVGADG